MGNHQRTGSQLHMHVVVCKAQIYIQRVEVGLDAVRCRMEVAWYEHRPFLNRHLYYHIQVVCYLVAVLFSGSTMIFPCRPEMMLKLFQSLKVQVFTEIILFQNDEVPDQEAVKIYYWLRPVNVDEHYICQGLGRGGAFVLGSQDWNMFDRAQGVLFQESGACA